MAKMMRLEGRAHEVPEEWTGLKPVYFCGYCESAPTVEKGAVAVNAPHDKCRDAAMTAAEDSLFTLLGKQTARLFQSTMGSGKSENR
jgi:hypothetical protein